MSEDNLGEIVFHQNVVAITSVTVRNSSGDVLNLRPGNQLTLDPYLELVHINFDSPITRGNYSITLRYNGRINTNPIDRGFYRGYYYYNGALR